MCDHLHLALQRLVEPSFLVTLRISILTIDPVKLSDSTWQVMVLNMNTNWMLEDSKKTTCFEILFIVATHEAPILKYTFPEWRIFLLDDFCYIPEYHIRKKHYNIIIINIIVWNYIWPAVVNQ